MIRPLAILLALTVSAKAEIETPIWPGTPKFEPLKDTPPKRKPQVRGWIKHAPAKVIVKRDVVSKPERIDDTAHCKPPLQAVGDQALSEDIARTAAEKHWMANVRWRDGEKYMDFKNSKVIHIECSRSSVPPTNGIVGQVLPSEHRCEIVARPCRPGLEK